MISAIWAALYVCVVPCVECRQCAYLCVLLLLLCRVWSARVHVIVIVQQMRQSSTYAAREATDRRLFDYVLVVGLEADEDTCNSCALHVLFHFPEQVTQQTLLSDITSVLSGVWAIANSVLVMLTACRVSHEADKARLLTVSSPHAGDSVFIHHQ